MQFSLARPEAHVVLGYIGLPRRVATQNGLAHLIEKLLVESAFGKGGVVLLQSPDRSLVRLTARGTILVDDIRRKVGIFPYLARLFRQLVRALPNLFLTPFSCEAIDLFRWSGLHLSPTPGRLSLSENDRFEYSWL